MNDQLDPQAMALTKAIRQVESGGNFKARSKDGSFGAYQFLKPTWDNTARKYGVNAEWEKATPQQQNEVAYKQIKEWKDKGHNVGEIASMWNAGAGRPQAYLQGLKGTNSSGVNYNVANYAKKVATLYQGYKGQVQPQVQQEPIEPMDSVEPVEPTIPEQKQIIQSQGLPTSARRDRTQPTLVGGIIRDIVKQPIKAALSVARPFVDPFGKKGGLSVNTKYLGNVGDYGTEIEKSTNNLANKYKAGEISLGRAAIGGAGAGALQAMDAASVVPVGGVAGSAVKGTVQKALIPTLKTAAKESLIRGGAVGAGYDVSSQLASGEKYNPLQTVAAGALGTVADLGLSYGLPKALNKGKEVIIKTPEQISTGVDKSIRNIFKGTTGDVQKINDSAFRARKGLELLQKESKNISIPDESAPLGSNITKKFDITKAKPNELLSAVNKLRQNVVTNARTAVKEASAKGFTLKTDDAKRVITEAVNNGDITPATASRLYKQIDNTKGDAEKIFDWVQEVNQKYKNRFEKGTIDDMATSRIANDIAEGFRKELNTITDRTGYAESMSNIKDLERLLVSVAKKANKNINFGDITTDAGLDLGISILTGNPAYMARTVGSGLFKSIVSKFRNNAGLRSFRSAVKGTAKLPTKTRLPYSSSKPAKLPPLLSEGKTFENKAGIQLQKPKIPTTFEARAKIINTQPRANQLGLPEGRGPVENLSPIRLPAPKKTVIEPRAKIVGYSNNDGNLNQRYNSTATASKTGISKVSRETPKKSITKQVVKTEPKIVKSKTLPTKNVEVITSVGDKKFTIKSPERIYNKGTRIVGEYNGKEYITNSLILEFKNDTGLTHDFAKTPKGPDSDAIQTLINKSKTGSKDIGKPVSMGDSGGGDKVFIFKDGTAVNPDYYNYVAKKYPNLKLEHNGTIGAIIVSSDDKMVGLLMPYNKIVENKNIVPIENVVKPTKRIISEESYKKALKNLGEANKKVAVELPTGLVQQAKKYKSAEEFVKAQTAQLPLYSGTIAERPISSKGIVNLTSNKNIAESYAVKGGVVSSNLGKKAGIDLVPDNMLSSEIRSKIELTGSNQRVSGKWEVAKNPVIEEVTFKGDPKILDLTDTKLNGGLEDFTHKLTAITKDTSIPLKERNVISNIVRDINKTGKFDWAYTKGYGESLSPQKILLDRVYPYLKNQGFDGITYKDYTSNASDFTTSIWNKDKIVTKSQLTDIWNKANKK